MSIQEITEPRSADDLIVEALASGRSQSEAAQLAHLSKRTVARRMSDPEFAARVSRRRGDVVAELAGRLTGLTEDAITAIGEVLMSGTPGDRLRAARLVITGVVALRRDGELEDRLREIEDELDQQDSSCGSGQ